MPNGMHRKKVRSGKPRKAAKKSAKRAKSATRRRRKR